MLMEGIVTRNTVTRNLPNKLGAPIDSVKEGEVLRITNIDSKLSGTWYYIAASGWIKSSEMQITRDIGFLVQAKKMKILDLQLFAPGTESHFVSVDSNSNDISSAPLNMRGIGGGILGGTTGIGGTGVVGAGGIFGRTGSIGSGGDLDVGDLTMGGGCFGDANQGRTIPTTNQQTSVGGVLSNFGVNVGGTLGEALNATSFSSLFDGSFLDSLLGNFMDSLFSSFAARLNFVLGFGDSDFMSLYSSLFDSLNYFSRGLYGNGYNDKQPELVSNLFSRTSTSGGGRKPQLISRNYTAADIRAREYFDYLGCANGKHKVMTSRVRLMGIDDPAYWMEVQYPIQSFGGPGSGMDFRTPTLTSKKVAKDAIFPTATLTPQKVDSEVSFNNEMWEAQYTDYKDAIDAVKKSVGLTIDRVDWFINFNRYRLTNPDYHLTGSTSHVFMTRPDLNLENNPSLSNCEDSAFFADAANRHSVIYKSLTTAFSGTHHFIPIISNTAMSLDLQDESLRTYEHGETLTKWKLKRAGNLIDSLTAGSFSITYVDDSQLSISLLHLIWLNYMSGLNRGYIEPRESYVRNAVIDYASSLYYILTDATGENIIFWTKYWGVFPTNFPGSSFSLSKNDRVHTPDISIQYDYSFKKSMDPLILAEFNRNSSGGSFNYVPVYNVNTFKCNGAVVGAPFVTQFTEQGTGKVYYKLRYRPA